MSVVITWVRNNLVTIVEIAGVLFDAVEVAVNGLMRLIPGNKHIIAVHDVLAKIGSPIKSLKSFLLNTVGS